MAGSQKAQPADAFHLKCKLDWWTMIIARKFKLDWWTMIIARKFKLDWWTMIIARKFKLDWWTMIIARTTQLSEMLNVRTISIDNRQLLDAVQGNEATRPTEYTGVSSGVAATILCNDFFTVFADKHNQATVTTNVTDEEAILYLSDTLAKLSSFSA